MWGKFRPSLFVFIRMNLEVGNEGDKDFRNYFPIKINFLSTIGVGSGRVGRAMALPIICRRLLSSIILTRVTTKVSGLAQLSNRYHSNNR